MLSMYQPSMDIAKNFSEIERKFLLKGAYSPSLVMGTTRVQRHYLYADSHVELRIQKKDKARYELERKLPDPQSPLVRWSMKGSITVGEFEKLRECAIGNTISYLKHDTNMPGVALKEYLDQLAGLVIVEVEFIDLQSAQDFHPSLSWVGTEITDRAYSRDSGLIHVANFDDLTQHLPVS